MAPKEQFVSVGDGLLVRAPAKINLSLLVHGKRSDGFHEIETIMAKTNWFDEILIQQRRKKGIELVCEGPCWAPEGEKNIVYRACKMLMSHYCVEAGLKITLTKNIPAGSGLGSASSDAAATLMGVNRFMGFSAKSKTLGEMASALGSDVSFFLQGPLALCRGKGDEITKLDQNFNFTALLMLPDVNVSTKRVYANYKHDFVKYKKLERLINNLIMKNRIDLVWSMCANMLEESCFELYRELAELKTKVEALGIRPWCLSGSGSAMFSILDKTGREEGRRFSHGLERKVGCRSIVVNNNGW